MPVTVLMGKYSMEYQRPRERAPRRYLAVGSISKLMLPSDRSLEPVVMGSWSIAAHDWLISVHWSSGLRALAATEEWWRSQKREAVLAGHPNYLPYGAVRVILN